MIQYEYFTVPITNLPTVQDLNGYGLIGWELCGINEGLYIFKRHVQRTGKAVKITDIDTGEVFHYDALQPASMAIGSSPTALNYALKHHTLYLKKYKVEEDVD